MLCVAQCVSSGEMLCVALCVSLILGSPLRGDASPSGGAKEILVCQDPKKFRGGDAATPTPTPTTEVQTEVKVEIVM